MIGHWDTEIASSYAADMYAAQAQAGDAASSRVAESGPEAGGAVPSRAAAMKARADFRYATGRQRKYLASTVEPGLCEACGWHTDWEPLPEDWNRVKCFYCQLCVCRKWCVLPGYMLCKLCHTKNGKTVDELPGLGFAPKMVPKVESATNCSSCGCCGSGEPGGITLLKPCHRCNRWLCSTCRQQQTPTACVVCPAAHATDGIDLKQVKRPEPAKKIEWLRRKADELTIARGRGRLSTGAYTHQHDIDGRAERIASAYAATKRPRTTDV